MQHGSATINDDRDNTTPDAGELVLIGAERARDQRFREILETSPVGVVILTRSLSRRMFANRRFMEMLGADNLEQLNEVGILDSFVDVPRTMERAAELENDGTLRGWEVQRKRLDGTLWWCRLDADQVDFEGQPAIVAWNYDITERKRAEGALQRAEADSRQAKDEAENHLRQLEEIQRELVRSERLAALGELTGTVSHELRNPLGTIANSLHLMRRALDIGDQSLLERGMRRAEKNITRCVDIIEQLLDYARVPELVKEPTVIDDWLRTVVEELEAPATVSVSLDLTAGARLDVDRERLHQVIVNVVQNAWQAIDGVSDDHSQGQVLVSSRATDQRLEIRIHDNGPGIADEMLASVFDALVSSKAFGVGLGLTLVRQVMEQHRGGAEFTSSDAGNTTLYLWLPIANED
jgi:PAS domain S-box-containing protein